MNGAKPSFIGRQNYYYILHPRIQIAFKLPIAFTERERERERLRTLKYIKQISIHNPPRKNRCRTGGVSTFTLTSVCLSLSLSPFPFDFFRREKFTDYACGWVLILLWKSNGLFSPFISLLLLSVSFLGKISGKNPRFGSDRHSCVRLLTSRDFFLLMADLMVIDVDESNNKMKTLDENNNSAKKSLKRKRASLVDELTAEERESRIAALNEELEGLFKYYKEVLNEKVNYLELRSECGSSSNSAIACLLEESNLSLSKLVSEIYEKVKEERDVGGITVASVKSSVVFAGQRCLYGVPNADADVLEDETESCLWCWEVTSFFFSIFLIPRFNLLEHLRPLHNFLPKFEWKIE